MYVYITFNTINNIFVLLRNFFYFYFFSNFITQFFCLKMARVSDSTDCKQCPRVLAEVEHIDDEADSAGINFVKIDDRNLAKQFGVFALPAILFFKLGSKEPVIYAGDLYDEQQILQWLLTQKDPSGDVIELVDGSELLDMIQENEALAIYFCKLTQFFFF